MTRWRAAAEAGAVVVGIAIAALWVLQPDRPARRVAPRTLYYTAYQGSDIVGGAVSAVDTSGSTVRYTDTFRGRLLVLGDSQTVEATATAYVPGAGPPSAVDSFAITVGGDQPPLRLRGYPRDGAPVLLPQLVPVALMLRVHGDPRGARGKFWIYNPVQRDAAPADVAIGRDTVFSVPSGAAFDRSERRWRVTQRDTVRAWHVDAPGASFSAWVDRDGRLVYASEPGGMRLERSAFGIAFGSVRPGN